jgi:hypothetical protein
MSFLTIVRWAHAEWRTKGAKDREASEIRYYVCWVAIGADELRYTTKR